MIVDHIFEFCSIHGESHLLGEVIVARRRREQSGILTSSALGNVEDQPGSSPRRRSATVLGNRDLDLVGARRRREAPKVSRDGNLLTWHCARKDGSFPLRPLG